MSIPDLIAIPAIFFLAVCVVMQLRAAWLLQIDGDGQSRKRVASATMCVFLIAAIVYLLGWAAP
jgi:hypothetical protein